MNEEKNGVKNDLKKELFPPRQKNAPKENFFARAGRAALHNLPFLAAGVLFLLLGLFINATLLYVAVSLFVAYLLSLCAETALTGAAASRAFEEDEAQQPPIDKTLSETENGPHDGKNP